MHPNDPLYSQQWYLNSIHGIALEGVWDEYSGEGVSIGIYDGGVDHDHADLIGNYDASREVWIDGVQIDGAPVPASDAAAGIGHGTSVAGVLVASGNNGEGIIGVAWGASFASVPILDPNSPLYINEPANAAAFYLAATQMVNFDITNNSWNNPSNYDPLNALSNDNGSYRAVAAKLDYVTHAGRGGLGTIIVQGAGNDATDVQGMGLNADRETITVAGTGQDGTLWAHSNYGAAILVSAPAVEFVTTDRTGALGYDDDDYLDQADNADNPPDGFAGTSLATPLVSGVAALMLDANPLLGWRDVENILAASARHTGSAIGTAHGGTEHSDWQFNNAGDWNGGGDHISNDYGYGLLNAHDAVRMAEAWGLFGPAQASGDEEDWVNWKWGNGTENDGAAVPDGETHSELLSLDPTDPTADNNTNTPHEIRIEHVDVRIDFQTADLSDLRFWLVSPDGTRIELYDGSIMSAGEGNDVATTKGAASSGLLWTYGVDGLRGELMTDQGTNWQLDVENVAGGPTTAQLYWFEVKVYGQLTSNVAAYRDDTYHYTDEFLAMRAIAGEDDRSTLSDAGGRDWIDMAAVTGAVALDLSTTAGKAVVAGTQWFTIAGGTTIENAVTGDGGDTLTGNATANQLYGMRGNDTLRGGAGKDSLDGGAGTHDLADYADKTDKVTLTLSDSSVKWALMKLGAATEDSVRNIEDILGGSAGDALGGNAAANSLTGAGGADTLHGGGGNDTLIGGVGKDSLTGGAGNDRFVFNAALSASSNVDTLTDFSHNHDVIALDNAVMKSLGSKTGALGSQFYAHSHATHGHDSNDHVVYDTSTGKLYYDSNASKSGGTTLIAQLGTTSHHPTIDSGDFVIV